MKLPIPFFKKKKEESKFYLALLLTDKKVEGAVLEEEDGKIKIVGVHREKLSSKIEDSTQEDLINVIDKVISRAEESLPPNIETHKTVFGVKEDWIEKESKKIKKEYLAKLKKLCDKLDLTPIGFIVINEAIANMLQSEEGAPLSAMLVDLGESKAELMLYRGGQVTEKVEGNIGESIATTIDHLLKNFTTPVLPSKLIVAHAISKEDLSKELNSHSWSKNLPFLHIPQINVLSENFYIKSVIYGTATQLGFDVLGLHALSNPDDNPDDGDPHEKPDITSSLENDEKESREPDNFGFMIDEDVKDHPQENDSAVKESLPTSAASDNPESSDDEIKDKFDVNLNRHDDEDNLEIDNKLEEKTGKNKNRIVAKLSSFIPVIPSPNLSKLKSLLGKNRKTKIIGIAAGGLIIALIALGIAFYSNSKAEIILSVKPNNVSKEEEVIFSISAGSDFSEKIIAAKTITAEKKGELEIATTGEKDVGEKATGTVTIFNNDNTPVTLNSGTEIKSSKGLIFTLTKNVNVASASGDVFSGTTPGKADADVQAGDIGTDSNIPSGTTFTIGTNSALAAKNDDAFSGGSSKTVKIVSEKDIASLRSRLIENLEKDSIKSLTDSAESNDILIPVILDTEFKDEKFDSKVGDEADKIKLAATITFIGATYEKDQLSDFAKSILKDEYSDDIVFADENIEAKIQDPKQENAEEISAILSINAGLLPEIDTEEIVKKIKGKSPKAARAMLIALPQVEKTEIKYTPNIFFLSNLLPKLPGNLEAKIVANEK